MIKSVQLSNFRRHADLDLRFDDAAQLILIAGSNGAGKSSILEGIVFALYGESRHGRKHLDRLTKRGRELEGMSAEVVFTIKDDEYRVHRRRDGKASTAVLYVNDIPLVEGPLQVTAEITSVLGMDSAGFRLAVIAQQKDLDGLATLRPAERGQMITRLLRLDAVTAAKTEANTAFRRERDLAAGLRGPDPAALNERIADLEGELVAATAERDRSSTELTLCDARLAASADVETLWNASMQNVARAQGALSQSRDQLIQRETELAQLVVPEPPAVTPDLVALTDQATELERRITQAEQQAASVEQRASVLDELATVQEKIATAEAALTAERPDVNERREEVERAKSAAATVSEKIAALRAEIAGTQALEQAAQRRLAQAQNLDAVCDSCGQEISASHRTQQEAAAAKDAAELANALAQLNEALTTATLDVATAQETVADAESQHARAAELERNAVQAKEALVELRRRAAVYESQLERLPQDSPDMDELYAKKGALAIALAEAQKAAERERERAALLAQRNSLQEAIGRARQEIPTLEQAVCDAQPGEDLKAHYQARQLAVEERKHEEEILQHWKTQIAVIDSTLAEARARRDEAQALAERQAQHQAAAVAAGAAGRLLGDVAERLATQIRPTLEGAISSILSSMSEGRFSSVRVTPDYDITVEDDGQWRTLSELSGGETDLVALATRLALSQVVADRHGAGGAGFLILDECFGSQDPQRRNSILQALRNLRGTYDQIFLISHVENIEDAVDMVINVQVSEDREETEVTLT